VKQQQRFILALVASAAVLILWNYLSPPVKPPQPNANANQQVAQASPQSSAQSSPTAQATAQPSATATPPPAQANASPAPTPDTVPERKIKVITPLYEATLDTRGAVVTSWVITKNKNTDRAIHAAGSTKDNPKKLEMIPAPPEGVAADQLTRTLQIVTGDATVDAALATRNFKVAAARADAGDETINVTSGSQQLDFVVHDDATGLDATKRITFFADRYIVNINLTLTRGGQPVPQTRLAIGPNIGDQGIDHYSFYLYAPEGISVVNNEARRVPATEVHADRRSSGLFGWIFEGLGLKSVQTKPVDRDPIDGPVQWAGVGDTYFAMLAVPAKPIAGLEYRTVPYEHKTNGKPEQRFLITGLVPVPSDGTHTELYVGPKDHRLLADASAEIKQTGGPQVDLGEAINYGFLAWMRRGLAVPILWSINALQRLTSSYGIAIILLTVLVRALMFPISYTAPIYSFPPSSVSFPPDEQTPAFDHRSIENTSRV